MKYINKLKYADIYYFIKSIINKLRYYNKLQNGTNIYCLASRSPPRCRYWQASFKLPFSDENTNN